MGAEARRPSVAASPPQENAGFEDNLGFSNRCYALTSEAQRQQIVEAEYLRVRALVRSLTCDDSWECLKGWTTVEAALEDTLSQQDVRE